MGHGLACVVLVLGLLAAGCLPSRPQRPVRLALPFWPAYELAWLARDLGYYDPRRVELIETHPPLDVERAYRQGIVDLAPLPLNEVLAIASHDPEQRVVLVIDFSNGGDAVVAHADVTRAADLKGRSIAVEPSTLGALLLTRFLEHAGLTRNDVTVLLIELDEHIDAFRSGRADAVITSEPIRTTLLQSGARDVFNSSQMPLEIADVLAGSAGLIAQRRDDVAHIVDGWLRALEELERRRDDAAARIARRHGVTPLPRSTAQVLSALEGVTLVGRARNVHLLGDQQSDLTRAAARATTTLRALRVIDRPPDLARLFDARFVKGAP
jgi:NitT/TauT family transport system substrate-binding protein